MPGGFERDCRFIAARFLPPWAELVDPSPVFEKRGACVGDLSPWLDPRRTGQGWIPGHTRWMQPRIQWICNIKLNSPQAWWRHFPKQTRCAVACGIERSLNPSARHCCCAVTHDKQAIVHCYLQLNQVNGAPLLCAALLCEQCKTRGIEVLRCTEGPGCQKAMGQADPKWDSKVTRSSVQFAFCGRQEIVWRNSVNFSVEQ